jgi:hypothetical protein
MEGTVKILETKTNRDVLDGSGGIACCIAKI